MIITTTTIIIIIIITITTICPLFVPLHQTIMMNDDECGAVGGMIGKRNRISQRKPAPVPLCSPQISHYLIRARTQA
jgi:hypothetical protein